MANEQNYYQVLGLIPDAEPAVIRAAYRALVAIYHPDKNGGHDSRKRIRDINAAYEVLSDPEQRRQYDAAREVSSHDASDSEFESRSPFTSTPIDKSWSVASKFYKNIDGLANDLERISWRMSFAFKLALLEGKKFADASKIARRMKEEYLSRYFGKDKAVLAYAEEIIKAGQKQAALYLNEIVNVMGGSVAVYQVKRQVEGVFTDLPDLLSARRIYSQILYSEHMCNNDMAARLVEHHGGTVKRKLYSSRVWIIFEDESHRFESTNEFCQYVVEKYAAYA